MTVYYSVGCKYTVHFYFFEKTWITNTKAWWFFSIRYPPGASPDTQWGGGRYFGNVAVPRRERPRKHNALKIS